MKQETKRGTITKVIVASAFLFVSPSAYSGDLPPPPRFPLEVAPPPTMKFTAASSISLGSFVVVFDKTTLGEAIEQIKTGEIQHQGDAAESVYWLCYSIQTPAGWEQLWLLSHGEMGGKEHVIYGVAAKLSSLKLPTASCPELPKNLRPVKLDNGFWLRSKKKNIEQKLGKPSLQRNQWLHYQSQRELLGDPRAKDFGTDKIYEGGSFSIRVVKGEVVEMWATKQTTD
jgi:hypothetical protein